MSQELIQEIDHLRAEIQQLKKELLNLNELLDNQMIRTAFLAQKVEAAKTILKDLPYMYAYEKEVYNWQENREAIEKLREVLESAQNSGEK